MKSVQHLVVGPFDMTQAVRELAEALEEQQAEIEKLKKAKPKTTRKPAPKKESAE